MFHKPWQRWTVSAFLLSLALYSLGSAWSQQDQKGLTAVERMKRDITFLTSKECEGRGPGTKGIDKAADYISQQFKEAGLKPGGVNGTWFQPFTCSGGSKLNDDKEIVVKLQGPDKQTIELKFGTDFQVLGNSGSGNVTAPLVFAGYGTTAKDINYDDYKDLDVAGKVLILIRRVPRFSNTDDPFDGTRKEQHASISTKFGLAETHKAAAIILINDASEPDDALVRFIEFSQATGRKLPVVQVKRAALEPVFKSGLKKTLADIEKAIEKDLKPQSAAVNGWSATVSCSVSRTTTPVKNVVGVAEGAGPLADETVVVGAHYDHLGYGGPGSRAQNAGQIHPGADDNGSGSTTVMELTRRFGNLKNRQGRRIVFMTYSAEELGFFGSRHYCQKEPLFPLEKTIAMVNLDMVGRLRHLDEDKKLGKPALEKGGRLSVSGLGTGSGFEELADKINAEFGFQLGKGQAAGGGSDHASFYAVKIPVFSLFTGQHPEYHTPKDTADLINVPGMKRIADYTEKVIAHLASVQERPKFMSVAPKKKDDKKDPDKKDPDKKDPDKKNPDKKDPDKKDSKSPRLGFVPDYDGPKDGLRVADVNPDGVAASAGMKAGDVIVEIAGKKVTDIETYMSAMANQKVGQTIDVTVMRDGKKVMLKALLK